MLCGTPFDMLYICITHAIVLCPSAAIHIMPFAVSIRVFTEERSAEPLSRSTFALSRIPAAPGAAARMSSADVWISSAAVAALAEAS